MHVYALMRNFLWLIPEVLPIDQIDGMGSCPSLPGIQAWSPSLYRESSVPELEYVYCWKMSKYLFWGLLQFSH